MGRDNIARALALKALAGGKGGKPQDLTETALCTLSNAEWLVLKNVKLLQHDASVSGLDPEYALIKVKININSTDYNAVLVQNSATSYTGQINILESDDLYQLDLIFNGSNKVLFKCTDFVVMPEDTVYNSDGTVLVDSDDNVITTTED